MNQAEEANAEEREIWPHPLPFMGQAVTDLGFELPKPFGISLTYNTMQHDLLLDNLEVGFRAANQPPSGTQPVSTVDFNDVEDDNKTALLRFDAWILPFFNVFALVGKLEGTTELTIDLDLRDFGIDRPISRRDRADYEGETYGIGFNLAGAYKNMFGVLNVTYNHSDVDIAPGSKIISLNVSPRIGLNSTVGDWGKLATYIGLTYLSYDMDIADSISVTNPAFLPIIGSPTMVIDYSIEASEKRNWNALIGANWDITRSWSLQAELQGGGLREQFVSSLTYRF